MLWYILSFLLGGIIGAPVLLTYGMYLLQRYIDSTPKSNKNEEEEEETARLLSEDTNDWTSSESRPIVVSKVGWIRITHDEKHTTSSSDLTNTAATNSTPTPPNSSTPTITTTTPTTTTSNNLTDMITNSFHSLLDRNKPNNPNQPTPHKRTKDACYAVLKQDKLMIYDSGNRVECRGVILMSEFTTLIYPIGLPDNEAFKKEYPLLLKYNNNEGSGEGDNDYYLYLDSPVEKESWYIALLNASQFNNRTSCYGTINSNTVDPLSFDRSAIEGLINTINSNDDHQQTKWLNALIGRIFLGIYKTQSVKDFFINKITTKTTKVKKPGFLGDIHVRDLHVGNSIPYITNPKLLSLSKDGELTAEMDLTYSGGFKAEIETEATLSVSARIKPLKVNMVLAVVLKSLTGRILLRVKPPPSNRFWIGFYEVPIMSLSIEPMVSDTQIRSSLVLQAIERRIHEMFKEAIVLPNMDDFCFFPSYGTGGIFNFAEGTVGDDDDIVGDVGEVSDDEDSKSKKSSKSNINNEGDNLELSNEDNLLGEYLTDHPTMMSSSSMSNIGHSSTLLGSDMLNNNVNVKSTNSNNSNKMGFGNTILNTNNNSTFNEKLRNLKESYFGGKKLKLPSNKNSNKEDNSSLSPLLVPSSPGSLSMPNLLVGGDRSPSLNGVSIENENNSAVPSPTLSIELPASNNSNIDIITTPPPAVFLPPVVNNSNNNSNSNGDGSNLVRKRKIIPAFVKLKEHLNGSGVSKQVSSNSGSGRDSDGVISREGSHGNNVVI